MTTGDRIRYYRKLNNMTMVVLAQKIGVKHSAIYKYETGRVTNIPIENIKNLDFIKGKIYWRSKYEDNKICR